MTPNPLYIPAYSLTGVFLDSVSGLPLSGGYLNLYSDLQRSNPKAIYQLTGTPGTYTFVSVGIQLNIGAGGQVVDAMNNIFVPYFYPYNNLGVEELYFIQVYNANNQLQYTLQAVPGLGATNIPPANTGTDLENQLANPQFVEVYFNPNAPLILTVNGSNIVSSIAPGWDFVSSSVGAATITISQLQPIATDTPTNPPYVLDITSTGLSSPLILRQRLYNSPRLGANNYPSAFLIAASTDATAHNISLNYVTSQGQSYNMAQGMTNLLGFEKIFGSVLITPPINSDPASTGYVDFQIVIPANAGVQISSAQLLISPALLETVNFEEQSTERQVDHLFHFYKNDVVVLPKDTLLAGWNFALNPWQFSSVLPTTIAASGYIADQTILSVQNVNSLSVSRSAKGFLEINTVLGQPQGRFGIIQYLDSATILPYWEEILSSLVKAYFATSNGTQLNFKMALIYSANLPTTVDPILSWATTIPTLTAQWNYITPLNDPTYTLTNGSIENFSFNQFTLPVIPSSTACLGILIYTTNTMDSGTTGDALFLDKISLVPNRFAIDTNSETFNSSLEKCRYYFESNYPLLGSPQLLPGSPSGKSKAAPQISFYDTGLTTYFLQTDAFMDLYSTKRSDAPISTFYDPSSGVINLVFGVLITQTPVPTVTTQTIPISAWIANVLGSSNSVYTPNNSTVYASSGVIVPQRLSSAVIFYNRTVDARLGLVP